MKANLSSLKQFRKILFLLVISFIIFSKTQAAENKFCLENDGFIMPMFEEKCENNNIALNKQEFVFIYEFIDIKIFKKIIKLNNVSICIFFI